MRPVSPEEFITKHHSNVCEIHSTPLIMLVNATLFGRCKYPAVYSIKHYGITQSTLHKSLYYPWWECLNTVMYMYVKSRHVMNNLHHIVLEKKISKNLTKYP